MLEAERCTRSIFLGSCREASAPETASMGVSVFSYRAGSYGVWT